MYPLISYSELPKTINFFRSATLHFSLSGCADQSEAGCFFGKDGHYPSPAFDLSAEALQHNRGRNPSLVLRHE